MVLFFNKPRTFILYSWCGFQRVKGHLTLTLILYSCEQATSVLSIGPTCMQHPNLLDLYQRAVSWAKIRHVKLLRVDLTDVPSTRHGWDCKDYWTYIIDLLAWKGWDCWPRQSYARDCQVKLLECYIIISGNLYKRLIIFLPTSLNYQQVLFKLITNSGLIC